MSLGIAFRCILFLQVIKGLYLILFNLDSGPGGGEGGLLYLPLLDQLQPRPQDLFLVQHGGSEKPLAKAVTARVLC